MIDLIVTCIFAVFFSFANFLIDLLPFESVSGGGLTSFFYLLGYGVYIVGTGPFAFVIGSFITWFVIHMGWAVIEWLYKKIPGVN